MDIRTRLREQRRNLSDAQQTDHAQRIERHLFATRLWDSVSSVAVYLANDGEVNLDQIITRLQRMSKRVSVPVLDGSTMRFSEWDADSTVKINRVGIREPSSAVHVRREELEVVLTPLVAFTQDGARLGRGGGYYDRYFTEKGETLIIGIAHELQKRSSVKRHAGDRCLDAVVTENGWTLCNQLAKTRIEMETT